MTLSGQNDHIRLDTRPAPGITPTLDTQAHTLSLSLSGLLAKLRKVTASWDPGQREEKRGKAKHSEYYLSVRPRHPIGRLAAAPACLRSPAPGEAGIPNHAARGKGWLGGRRFYFPACQDLTSHPETQSTLLVPCPTAPPLMGTPTSILKPCSESFCCFGNEEVLQPRSRKRNRNKVGMEAHRDCAGATNHQLFPNRKLKR